MDADKFPDNTAVSDLGVGDSAGDVFIVLRLYPYGDKGKNIAVFSNRGVRFDDYM
jgi:hypothetical protein